MDIKNILIAFSGLAASMTASYFPTYIWPWAFPGFLTILVIVYVLPNPDKPEPNKF